MGRFLEYWKMAYFNIRMNKVRSFLTMLGIIIGISSVVGILSIGNGFSNYVSGSLNGMLGSNFSLMSSGSVPIPTHVMDNLVDKYPYITGYTEDLGIDGTTLDRKKKEKQVMLSGGQPIKQTSVRSELIYGRFYDERDYEEALPVCIIDTYTSRQLFGKEDALGKIIKIDSHGREFSLKVIGIRKSDKQDDKPAKKENTGDEQEDNALIVVYQESALSIEVPTTVITEAFGLDRDSYYNYTVFVDEPGHVTEMSNKGQRYVEAAMDKRGENAFYSFEVASLVGGISKILGGITAFVMLVAALSLFVGGVGVMNIMLVSVTERTREIGIRKSLGARTSSIMWQFLIESGLISLTGGIIGMLLGYAFSGLACGIVHLVQKSITMTPDFNPLLILGVAAFSMAIGIVFGLYPAGKAARMTPIDALRHR